MAPAPRQSVGAEVFYWIVGSVAVRHRAWRRARWPVTNDARWQAVLAQPLAQPNSAVDEALVEDVIVEVGHVAQRHLASEDLRMGTHFLKIAKRAEPASLPPIGSG